MAAEPLRDLAHRDAVEGGLAEVEARLEAESEQTGAGLRATFVLAAGAKPVELLNPLDLLQWQLLDESGGPLAVPSRPPNLRVHRPAAEPWKLDSALPIAEVRRDGKPADPTALDSPTLVLGPEGELAVTFEFDRFVKGGAPTELPSGDYRLVCLATLIDASDPSRSRIVRCNPLPIRFDRLGGGE